MIMFNNYKAEGFFPFFPTDITFFLLLGCRNKTFHTMAISDVL